MDTFAQGYHADDEAYDVGLPIDDEEDEIEALVQQTLDEQESTFLQQRRERRNNYLLSWILLMVCSFFITGMNLLILNHFHNKTLKKSSTSCSVESKAGNDDDKSNNDADISPTNGLPSFACPQKVDTKLPGNYDTSFEEDYLNKTWTTDMKEFQQSFRTKNYDAWGMTYEEVKQRYGNWKVKAFLPYIKQYQHHQQRQRQLGHEQQQQQQKQQENQRKKQQQLQHQQQQQKHQKQQLGHTKKHHEVKDLVTLKEMVTAATNHDDVKTTTIFESACGIGLNLYLTLEMLYEEIGSNALGNIVVFGNEYVPDSVVTANAIFDDIPPFETVEKGTICAADSMNLSFVPSNSFDIVFTGYISTLLDPLHFDLGSLNKNRRYYRELCDSEQREQQKLAELAQEKQEVWFGQWIAEMTRLVKPGGPIIIENTAIPFCEKLSDWGGVSREWMVQMATENIYDWNVDPTSLYFEDSGTFHKRYHVVMTKKE